MKKISRNIIAIVLAVVISCSFVCLAKEVNEEAANAHRGQFKKYVLLGDSVASGYRDVITDNDDLYNKTYQETAYCRVPGSYADVLTKAIIEDNTMTAFAGPGYRTIEIRYMLEDDFDEADDYMFHPAQMNTVGDAGSEEYRKAYKNAIKEADLITLGVGGNDWGAYLGWVIADVFEEENVADEYKEELQKLLEDMEMGTELIEKLVDLAHVAGALPGLADAIPSALSYGLGNFYKNWDIMIQDIYDLNPDVTLMVLGMSDNSYKGNYFDYEGVVGGPVNGDGASEPMALVTTIVDFIMTVGNTPMIEGAKKFGYTYVDTSGTTYVESHPDAAGHIHIANKIMEALPDYEIHKKYTDITTGHKYYNDVEYVVKNGLMTGETDTTFNPDSSITKGQLNFAFNQINATDNPTDSTENATVRDFASVILSSRKNMNFMDTIRTMYLAFSLMADKNFDLVSDVSRGESAKYIKKIDMMKS